MPPAFGVITGQWYRHAEQPVRIAAWYGTNASQQLSQQVFHSDSPMFPAAPLSHGRFVTASFVYWRLENDVKTARFLTGHQRAQAIERLRANNTGIGSREFNWSQVIEVFLDPKTYLWFALTLLLNVGAATARERKRVANGKPAKLTDRSMMDHYEAQDDMDSGNGDAAQRS
ncbi:hypothetical protein VC83_03171 [Pseudogymnoascus destructans]|uniref:Uncharacterized protein n=1 Tax=Pseudogymnoascus destructans TaxID=655981 RepID=A0A177ADR5_9PEZI|nr:uncharacterized protein VC83_03171 [Pseudogymnoascus destructans]OAF60238.1 hypothetical protein VC83_03171 [Pseudogymnoascus destructans]